MTSCGLSPGAVCDLFVYRQRYDDQQHGLKRKTEDPEKAGIE